MAPLVLHNVPDDELYTGRDGVKRPFAVVREADERRSARLRRQATASQGSFGRARSRQRAGSVGPGGGRSRQQAKATATSTTTAADEVFGTWKKNQELLYQQQHSHADQEQQQDGSDFLEPGAGRPSVRRKVSAGSSGPVRDDSPPPPQQQQQQQFGSAAGTNTQTTNFPVEVVLYGYRSAEYQYAAIRHYEQIAGRICEDYPRDPPVASRRYRSSLRDAAARSAANGSSSGGGALTPIERQAVMQRAASGEHWVKVTFESTQAADAALYASPQSIMGYCVFAELYDGVPLPPSKDVAVPDPDALPEHEQAARGYAGRRAALPPSPLSSQTVESGTVTLEGPLGAAAAAASSTTTSSSATLEPGAGGGSSSFGRRRPRPLSWGGNLGGSAQYGRGGGRLTTSASQPNIGDGGNAMDLDTEEAEPEAGSNANKNNGPGSSDPAFCRTIPTARRATLKAPEQALLPRESTARRVVKRLPLLHRLTGTIIGNQVPRKENGLFDWDKASLYWRLIWWLDFLFALFSGEILDANKDEE